MVGERRLPSFETSKTSEAPKASWLDQPLLASLTWEKVAYLVLIGLAILSRFWNLDARVMSHDESLHTYFAYQLSQGKGFQHTPLMHGPFLFHITALMYFLFGANDFTSRIAPAIFGVILVALPYFLRRWLGRAGALFTSFMFLISPSILYHARYARQEEFILVWTLLTVLCIWRYLEDRQPGWLIGLAAVLAFHATDKSTSFLIVAMFLAFLAPLSLWQLYRARKRWQDAGMLIAFGAATAALMIALSALFVVGGGRIAQLVGMQSLVSPNNLTVLNLDTRTLLYVLIMVTAAALIGIGIGWLYRYTFSTWLRLASDKSPAFSVIIVMVTTSLFLGSPAMLLVLNRIWHLFGGADLVAVNLLGNMANLQANVQVITTMFSLALALIVIAVAIGVVWDWQRWLAIAGVFLAITFTLFTTVFTNTAGIGTGFVGQLGYWMAQQEVQRGSQPWYYYFLIVPLYEYTVIFGSLGALVTLVVDLFMSARSTPRLLAKIRQDLFTIFLVWWTLATWVIYTLAGEKMPWLSVHFALPMALLTGWFIDRVVRSLVAAFPGETSERRNKLVQRGLATAGLSILSVVLFVRMLSLIGGMDLTGAREAAVTWITSFAFAAVALAVVGYLLGRVANGAALSAVILAGFALLSAVTIRTTVAVTYINYDYTKEFLFYAHGAPGVKVALRQIEDLAERVGGREPLTIGYDSDTSWPMSWYMRSFPGARFYGESLPPDYQDMEVILVGDANPKLSEITEQLANDYSRFDYMLIWWPMQDYYDLNWDRISYSLFNPQARAALWEIAFNRNFEPYSRLFNKNSLTPETWSPGHHFSTFVRNDVAQQLWDYQVGAVAANVPRVTGPRLVSPAGLTFAADGARFVIDHKANRVFKLDEAGNVLSSWGGAGSGPGKFNDAWGIAIDDAQNVYVADTFNHRIQKFDLDGNALSQWGRPGATNAPGTGRDTQFFGPRDIAIDSQGRLLVTDTGNKRVQVFDAEGNFITQFGEPGSDNGKFNEPVGLAIDSDGNIYVADTWNKRIQVFDPNFKFLRAWPVQQWEKMDSSELQAVDHKPYLAIDSNTVLVSSPHTHEVLAYSLSGSPIDLPGVTFSTDDLPTGIKVRDGVVHVTNAKNGQVIQFPLGSGTK